MFVIYQRLRYIEVRYIEVPLIAHLFSFVFFFKKFSRLRPPTKCNDDFKVICSKRKLNGKLSREWMNGVVSKGRVSSRDEKCRQNNRRMCKILIL